MLCESEINTVFEEKHMYWLDIKSVYFQES